jgi:hypothetical protein
VSSAPDGRHAFGKGTAATAAATSNTSILNTPPPAADAQFLALTLALMFLFTSPGGAPLHSRVLVFVPAYEGSKLYDPTLAAEGDDPPCVWGDLDAIRDSNSTSPCGCRTRSWPGRC